MSGAQVSAARWTPSMAHAAAHDFELLPAGRHCSEEPVVLHVDTAHSGIGGTGGATDAVWRFHKQYLIDPRTEEWNYTVTLTPLGPKQLEVAAGE
mmetsp:Transcript_9745/g.16945  ORF Transcript_9745/g.16945 Transcript_9745/m.16945 type:complete len:95 (+) Transcript_9745:3-287(+)